MVLQLTPGGWQELSRLLSLSPCVAAGTSCNPVAHAPRIEWSVSGRLDLATVRRRLG